MEQPERHMTLLALALAASGLLRLAWRPLSTSSLAWALHVAMDAVTHGAGRFQTTVLYPLATWSLDSIRWWQHPVVILGYWLVLPAIWYGLRAWLRRHAHGGA